MVVCLAATDCDFFVETSGVAIGKRFAVGVVVATVVVDDVAETNDAIEMADVVAIGTATAAVCAVVVSGAGVDCSRWGRTIKRKTPAMILIAPTFTKREYSLGDILSNIR